MEKIQTINQEGMEYVISKTKVSNCTEYGLLLQIMANLELHHERWMNDHNLTDKVTFEREWVIPQENYIELSIISNYE